MANIDLKTTIPSAKVAKVKEVLVQAHPEMADYTAAQIKTFLEGFLFSTLRGYIMSLNGDNKERVAKAIYNEATSIVEEIL